MEMKKGNLIIGLMVGVFVFSAHAFGANYTITDLGTINGTTSQAYGINDTGQVVVSQVLQRTIMRLSGTVPMACRILVLLAGK